MEKLLICKINMNNGLLKILSMFLNLFINYCLMIFEIFE